MSDTSTEAPPAPTGEDAGAQVPSPPPAASAPSTDDAPSIESYVNDETLDLAASGLPEKTQGEIKKLRADMKKYRETATTWEQATQGWEPADIDMLRQALSVATEDPTAVGRWMIDNAQVLLGDEFAKLVGVPVDQGGEQMPPEDEAELTPERIKEMVNEALAQQRKEQESQQQIQQRVQAIIDKTDDLGFGPSHPMHEALLSVAKARTNGDLEKAAELLIENGARPANSTNEPTDAPPEGGHTPVPPEGGTPAGNQTARDPRQAAQERLDRTLGAATGFTGP